MSVGARRLAFMQREWVRASKLFELEISISVGKLITVARIGCNYD
jgi:hypothetical protein